MEDLELLQDEGQQDQPEKVFSQADVDRIVGERLHRERSKHETELAEYKETLNELEEFGYTGTVQEKRQAIRAYKEELKKAQELESLQDEATQSGTSPELLAEIRELKKELSEIKAERQAKETAMKEEVRKNKEWEDQITEFEEAYSDVDLKELNNNDRFIKFIKGKQGTLKDLYADFVDFIGDTEKSTIIKMKSKEARSTTSSKGSGGSDGGTYGLNSEQLATLEDWNRRNPQMKMSPKEFSQYYK
jgi:chromosome segregation ATPase